MAVRAQPINKGIALAGSAAILVVALLVLAPVGALFARAEGAGGISTYGWSVVRFTVFQAVLSALISVTLAIPVASALARRDFRGRGLVLSLMGAPFLLPSIVAVFGLLAIWGRSGIFSDILASFGAGPLDIYGLTGILLAHVFFNLPLVVRMILQGWAAVPVEHFRLAAQLGLGPRPTFRLIEMPLLRGVVPAAFLVTFLLCMTSFAIVLALGGGPKATTVELAIYNALRFEFDLSSAAMLAIVQFALCITAAIVALNLTQNAGFGGGLMTARQRWGDTRLAFWQDTILITITLIFLGLPMLAILFRGINGLGAGLPSGILTSLLISLGIALTSAALAISLALALAHLIDSLRGKFGKTIEVFAFLTLAASPFVIGTGLFIMINPYFSPFALALPITALVNAAITLPLALRILLPALTRIRQNYGQTADSIGMQGWARFRLLTWPQMRAEIGFATGLCAALSMGDLGVITLFAPPDIATLPLVMYRLMGSYRIEAAAAVALILTTSSFTLFWIFDRGGRLGNTS
ncbi:MAG: thiamine/thiamine pyrophosphate ABC transporter permease ThiP [Rhodobacteraceae bacterium]|nr:thiamine/thiamine pyrophosphate ABC transporter permease ThiP [Paracoccaceae bacterium]